MKAYWFEKGQFEDKVILLDSKKEEIFIRDKIEDLDLENWKIESKKELPEKIGLLPGQFKDFYRGYIVDFKDNLLYALYG